MKRKYLGVGLMAALVFSAAPLSGTAGANDYPEADPDRKTLNKCVVVSDVGNGKVTVRKNKNDEGKTVELAAGDTLVVCLNVAADVDAMAQLHVDADLTAAKKDECGGIAGSGFDLIVHADVEVAPGFEAIAKLTATVHANANVSGTDSVAKAQTVSTGDVPIGNDPEDGIAPALEADASYCKTVGRTPPPNS